MRILISSLLLFFLSNLTLGQFIQIIPKRISVNPTVKQQSPYSFRDGKPDTYFKSGLITDLNNPVLDFGFEFEEELPTHVVFQSNFIGSGIKQFKIEDAGSRTIESHTLSQTGLNQLIVLKGAVPAKFKLSVDETHRSFLPVNLTEISWFKNLPDDYSFDRNILNDTKAFKKLIKRLIKAGIEPSLLAFEDGQNLFREILQRGNTELMGALNGLNVEPKTVGVVVPGYGSRGASLLEYYQKNKEKLDKVDCQNPDFKSTFNQWMSGKNNAASNKNLIGMLGNFRNACTLDEYSSIYQTFQSDLSNFLFDSFTNSLSGSSLINSLKQAVVYGEITEATSMSMEELQANGERFFFVNWYSLREGEANNGGRLTVKEQKLGVLYNYLHDDAQEALQTRLDGPISERVKNVDLSKQISSELIRMYARLNAVNDYLNGNDTAELNKILSKYDSLINLLPTYRSNSEVAQTIKNLNMEAVASRFPENERLQQLNSLYIKKLEELREVKRAEKANAKKALRTKRLNKLLGIEKQKRDYALANGYIYKNFYFWHTLGGFENQTLAAQIFHGEFDLINKKDSRLKSLFNAFVAEYSGASAMDKSGLKKFVFKEQVLTRETDTYMGYYWVGTDREYRTDYTMVYVDPRIAEVYDMLTKYTESNGFTSAHGSVGSNTNIAAVFSAMSSLKSGNLSAFKHVARVNAGAISMATGIITYFGEGSKGMYQFRENLYRLMLDQPSLQQEKQAIEGTKSSIDSHLPDYESFPFFYRFLDVAITMDSKYEPNSLEYRYDQEALTLSSDYVDFCVCVNNAVTNELPSNMALQRIKSIDNVLELVDEIVDYGSSHPQADFVRSINFCKGN